MNRGGLNPGGSVRGGSVHLKDLYGEPGIGGFVEPDHCQEYAFGIVGATLFQVSGFQFGPAQGYRLAMAQVLFRLLVESDTLQSL